MTATISTVTGATGANATGNSGQRHIVYAANSGVFWAFWIDPATPTVLRSAYSVDLNTWTASSTVTLANAVGNTGDGRFLAVAYANIGGTDVVHVVASCITQHVYDNRGVLTANSVTWATNQVTDPSTGTVQTPDGLSLTVASDGGLIISSGGLDTGTGVNNSTHTYNATADTTGASWTPGAWTTVRDHLYTNNDFTHAVFPLASGKALAMWGSDAVPPNNVTYSVVDRSGSAVAPANVFGTNVAFGDSVGNDWGATKVSNTDIHAVRITGSNTYEHVRFNGTSWVAGQSIPNQTSLSGGGVALTSDGTNVYLFVIDSAAGNAVQGCIWSNGAWGSWSVVESSSATRNNVTACQETTGASRIAVSWTEGAASPFAIKVASLNALASTTRTAFQVATSLQTKARSAFLVRTAVAIASRVIFPIQASLRTNGRGIFQVSTKLSEQSRATFKIAGNFVNPAGLVLAFQSAVNRMQSAFSELTRLANSWSSTNRLTSTFTRSAPVAQPNSTIDVTATVKLPDGTFPTMSTIAVTVTFPDGTTGNYSLAGGQITSLGSGQYKLTYTTKSQGNHVELWTFTATDGSTAQYKNVTGCNY